MALSEAELRAVTIGELGRLDGPVTLVAYDPAWPELFAREERRIRAALGPRALHVEHASDGCSEVGRVLLFRDWLCTHAHERDLYERTKRARADAATRIA